LVHTTVIAAEKTGRHAHALEIDPKYVDVAVRRWQLFNGRQAFLEGTTDCFDEIDEERSSRRQNEQASQALTAGGL
jgi:DNA modification methylase